ALYRLDRAVLRRPLFEGVQLRQEARAERDRVEGVAQVVGDGAQDLVAQLARLECLPVEPRVVDMQCYHPGELPGDRQVFVGVDVTGFRAREGDRAQRSPPGDQGYDHD